MIAVFPFPVLRGGHDFESRHRPIVVCIGVEAIVPLHACIFSDLFVIRACIVD